MRQLRRVLTTCGDISETLLDLNELTACRAVCWVFGTSLSSLGQAIRNSDRTESHVDIISLEADFISPWHPYNCKASNGTKSPSSRGLQLIVCYVLGLVGVKSSRNCVYLYCPIRLSEGDPLAVFHTSKET